jgi:hypothetical protein
MARLKVKQISDFSSAVQTLIDSDADQNASIIEQISTDLSSEVSTTNSDVTSIDAVLASVGGSSAIGNVSDALSVEISTTNSEVTSINVRVSNAEDDTTAVSNALSTEISTTNSDVTSIDTELATKAAATDLTAVSNALSTEVSTTNSEVLSIDVRVSNEEDARDSVDTELSAEIATEKGRVDAILAGSDADLDQFSEVISYVDSLDTADGGALTTGLASLTTALSNNTSNDVLVSNALSAEISATNSDVTSIDAVLASVGGDAAIGAVSDALSTEISTTNSEVTSLEVLISSGDSLDVVISNALSTEVSTTNSEVLSLDTLIDGVSSDLSSEISATGSEITSLETALNGFAKESFIHLVATGLVSGSGQTVQVFDTAGVINGDNVTEAAGTYTFDLVIPMEAVNAIEGEAGLIDLQINGLGVDHSAVRWNNATSFSLMESQLGYVLDADDRVEFKYIRD